METDSNLRLAYPDISSLASFTLNVAGKDIYNDDIIDLQINWGSMDVNGSMILKDTKDYFDTGIFSNDTEFYIYFVDSNDAYFLRYFKTVNYSLDYNFHDKRDKTVTINFEDKISHTLKRTFISKSFNGKLSDIISSYFTHLKIDDIIAEEKITKEFSETSLSAQTVVPADRSLFDFLRFELSKQGYVLYQFRDKINLVKLSDILPDKQKENKIEGKQIVYNDRSNDNRDPFLLRDVIFKTFNNSSKMNSTPKESVLYFDYETKTVKETKLGISNLFTSLKLGTEDNSTELQFTTGSKLIDHPYSDVTKVENEMLLNFQGNVQFAAIVVGSIDYTTLFSKIFCQFNPSMSTVEGSKYGFEYLSGYYSVTGIKDKIIGGAKFIQMIECSRVNFDKIQESKK